MSATPWPVDVHTGSSWVRDHMEPAPPVRFAGSFLAARLWVALGGITFLLVAVGLVLGQLAPPLAAAAVLVVCMAWHWGRLGTCVADLSGR